MNEQQRKAMKLALEALRTLHDENMDYLTRNKLGGENNQCMVFAREAITALQEALSTKCVAQPEQDPYDEVFIAYGLPKPEQSTTWRGLTNKDIYDCEPKTDWYDPVEFYQAIEDKLKAKNT